MVQWKLDKQEQHQEHDIEPANDSIRIRDQLENNITITHNNTMANEPEPRT